MSELVYRRRPGTVRRERGDVIAVLDGCETTSRQPDHVTFRCPCGERMVSVRRPPHSRIEFDEDGRLTVEGSIANRAGALLNNHGLWLDAGACHFHVTAGRAVMCDDVTCPGFLHE